MYILLMRHPSVCFLQRFSSIQIQSHSQWTFGSQHIQGEISFPLQVYMIKFILITNYCWYKSFLDAEDFVSMNVENNRKKIILPSTLDTVSEGEKFRFFLIHPNAYVLNGWCLWSLHSEFLLCTADWKSHSFNKQSWKCKINKCMNHFS